MESRSNSWEYLYNSMMEQLTLHESLAVNAPPISQLFDRYNSNFLTGTIGWSCGEVLFQNLAHDLKQPKKDKMAKKHQNSKKSKIDTIEMLCLHVVKDLLISMKDCYPERTEEEVIYHLLVHDLNLDHTIHYIEGNGFLDKEFWSANVIDQEAVFSNYREGMSTSQKEWETEESSLLNKFASFGVIKKEIGVLKSKLNKDTLIISDLNKQKKELMEKRNRLIEELDSVSGDIASCSYNGAANERGLGAPIEGEPLQFSYNTTVHCHRIISGRNPNKLPDFVQIEKVQVRGEFSESSEGWQKRKGDHKEKKDKTEEKSFFQENAFPNKLQF